jgi:phosphinothricin acetyltransferase
MEPMIRAAAAADLPGIAAIYNDAILNSTATFDVEPWDDEQCRRWLREHGHPYAVIVAVGGDPVLGWASLSPFRAKAAYQYTAENSVYVRDDLRGNGIGGLLLARLLEVAAENGFRTVIARIAGDNPVSVRLHERYGFRTVGVEREVGHKFGRWLDVVVMQMMVGEQQNAGLAEQA